MASRVRVFYSSYNRGAGCGKAAEKILLADALDYNIPIPPTVLPEQPRWKRMLVLYELLQARHKGTSIIKVFRERRGTRKERSAYRVIVREYGLKRKKKRAVAPPTTTRRAPQPMPPQVGAIPTAAGIWQDTHVGHVRFVNNAGAEAPAPPAAVRPTWHHEDFMRYYAPPGREI